MGASSPKSLSPCRRLRFLPSAEARPITKGQVFRTRSPRPHPHAGRLPYPLFFSRRGAEAQSSRSPHQIHSALPAFPRPPPALPRLSSAPQRLSAMPPSPRQFSHQPAVAPSPARVMIKDLSLCHPLAGGEGNWLPPQNCPSLYCHLDRIPIPSRPSPGARLPSWRRRRSGQTKSLSPSRCPPCRWGEELIAPSNYLSPCWRRRSRHWRGGAGPLRSVAWTPPLTHPSTTWSPCFGRK
jgi:hypothetical protein